MFAALPGKPDADALERAILEFWAAEDIFGKLRARNAGGPRFSYDRARGSLDRHATYITAAYVAGASR